MSSSRKPGLGDSTSVTGTSKGMGFLLNACGRAIAGSYGLFVYSALFLSAYTSNRKFRYMNENDRQELQLARKRLWDLQATPWSLLHKFIDIRGVILHYVLHEPKAEIQGSAPLVVFIHGFPDSWHIWHHYLRDETLREKAILVAVDLPGYGGSDSLDISGPDEVLNTMTEYVVAMREQYQSVSGTSKGPVIVVGHDWGAVVAFRFASEAPHLADRFIISNGVHAELAKANAISRIQSSYHMFRAWRSRPFRFRTLLHALQNWRPLLTQAERSGYVFALNLPYFLTDILGKFGNFWMYRLMNAIACNSPKKPLQGPEGWDMMASSLGPSQAEAGSSGPSASSAVNQNVGENGIREAPFAYPPSVALRAALGGWRSKIGVYRHGLAFSPWTKSLDVLVRLDELQYEVRSPSVESPVGAERGGLAHQLSGSRVGGVLDLGPAGSFGAPTTVLWGKRDIAVEMGLATDGMADYFGVAGSQFVVVEKATHWTPLDPTAIPVWKAVLLWATTGEHGRLEEVVGNMDGVKIVAES